MPIVDVEVVAVNAESSPARPLAALANTLGRVFGSPAGHTWVRLRCLPASRYAENDASIADDALPVFVTVLHARLPQGPALEAEVAAITGAVAAWLEIALDRVHVGYGPPAAGRQAFGGRLVQP